MTIAITVNGKRVVVPGVYSTFAVEDNLANVTPAPRNAVIVGEANKGVPGNLLDIRGVGFTSYADLKAFYGSGPLVDAARMLFANQPSPEFAGGIGTLYAYKTNESGLASSNLLQGVTVYGELNAVEYGIDGNLIKRQIIDGQTEVKPSFTAYWLPRGQSSDFKFRVNGGTEESVTVSSTAAPFDVVSGVTGANADATGGAALDIISAAQVTALDKITLTAVGHRITLTMTTTLNAPSTFQGADVGSLLVNQPIYIPISSGIAGAGQENAGDYVIVSASASSIVADKIVSLDASGNEVAPVAPVTVSAVVLAGSQSAVATAEVMAFNTLTMFDTATTPVGVGATTQVYNASGALNIAQRFWNPSSQLNPVSAAVAAVASVAVAVSSSVGTFSITGGSFSVIPSIGDTLWIGPSSPLAGASQENVGAWVVSLAGSTSITATKVIAGGATVTSVALSNVVNPFVVQPMIVSTSIAGNAIKSTAERQIYIDASRQTDGLTFPTTLVGGKVVLEIGYNGSATATLSIDKNGKLTTSCANSAHNLTIILAQFNTMGDLIAFINTQAYYSARITSLNYNALNPRTVLDKVQTVGICGVQGGAISYPGRIKSDYYDFKNLLDGNSNLIAFAESTTLTYKAGLPTSEVSASFLTGGSLGGTTNADVLAGFDAALKVSAVQVIPLFSRDAAADVEDGLTDPSSSYSIDAINEAAKAHALTASNDLNRKERFAIVSYHDSFANTKLAASRMSSERVQMLFQMARTINSLGNIVWFQPWMLACAFAAGRIQANLGIPMLRKSFGISDIKHIGAESVYSDTLVVDFDPDTEMLSDAITSGLLVLRTVSGAGIRLESPDLTTRSRDNDPKAWVYERASVLFTCDVCLDTSRKVLDNYIGNRTSDTSTGTVKNALVNTLNVFTTNGSLLTFSIDDVKKLGNGYNAKVSVFPAEAVEFITLDVLARRQTT